jgi:hypothetical protein
MASCYPAHFGLLLLEPKHGQVRFRAIAIGRLPLDDTRSPLRPRNDLIPMSIRWHMTSRPL